ncbi:MAG: efflux RND transporter periplasmic adaptor subunit [Acidobacteriota bacterium]
MKRFLGILFALAVLAALAAPKLRTSGDTSNLPAPASSEPRKLRVTVQTVEPEHLTERLSTTGTVRANEQVELVGEITGKIAAIHFNEGSRVSKGQLLLEIDDAELQAERERTALRVELAERREAKRKQLLDDGVISDEEYALALNQLEVLRAEHRLIEAQLLKTEIRAPFGGIIGLRYVSLGSYLSPQTQIATLQDVDSVKVDFSVPEKYAARMQRGGEITFRVKGEERPFTGTIYAIEPSVDQDTRSLPVRARSANREGSLVPGAFADVEIVVAESDDAVTVPAIAVIPELGGKKVFVAEDGKAQSRTVTTGIRTEDRVQITSGLAAGERVIVSAIQQLRPGLDIETSEGRD